MEPYYSLVFSFGLHTVLSDKLVDIVGEVPEEIGVMILRLLDPRTLLSAALVSKKWLNLCHADSTLRKRILQQTQQEKTERLKPVPFMIERDLRNRCLPLSTLNGKNRIIASPGSSMHVIRGYPPTIHPIMSMVSYVIHTMHLRIRSLKNLPSMGRFCLWLALTAISSLAIHAFISQMNNTVRPELKRIWAPVVRHFGCLAAGQPNETAKKKKLSKLKSLGKTSMASIAKRMRM